MTSIRKQFVTRYLLLLGILSYGSISVYDALTSFDIVDGISFTLEGDYKKDIGESEESEKELDPEEKFLIEPSFHYLKRQNSHKDQASVWDPHFLRHLAYLEERNPPPENS